MVIQLPILFALYPVIQEVPRYVNGIKEIYMPVVNQIMATDGYQKILERLEMQLRCICLQMHMIIQTPIFW